MDLLVVFKCFIKYGLFGENKSCTYLILLLIPQFLQYKPRVIIKDLCNQNVLITGQY